VEENKLLESLLAKENIVIEDVPHVSEINPVQESHDPVFAEALVKNLKLSLNTLILRIFGQAARELIASGVGKEEPLRVRWIEAYFPFTSPSFEVEVFYQGKWMEILGCGVVKQATLDTAGGSL
jgi:phenylalanyl-tRNA synthetase alpha chain